MTIKTMIIRELNHHPKKIIELSERLFNEAFPEPKGSFQERALRDMLLVSIGNRPEETSNDQLQHFCISLNVIHWEVFDPQVGLRHFFRSN